MQLKNVKGDPLLGKTGKIYMPDQKVSLIHIYLVYQLCTSLVLYLGMTLAIVSWEKYHKNTRV